MKKSLYTILISASLLGATLFPTQAFADCTQLYGGGQTCNNFSFTVNKLVAKPDTKGGTLEFVMGGFSQNDPKFSPSGQAVYQILVKNTGSTTITTLTVTDRIPELLTFVAGPGSYDSGTKTLTYTINNLGAGQTNSQNITVKIADANMLPDQSTTCMINIATGTDNNGQTQNSNQAQLCVQKTVLGTTAPVVLSTPNVKSTPATGPEMLPLAMLIPGALAGLKLRKRAVKTAFKGGEK